MSIPIEDEYVDVLQKAAMGLRLSPTELSERTGLDLVRVRAVLKGELNVEILRVLAGELNLNADALVDLANGDWVPQAVSLAGLHQLNLPFPYAGWPGASVNVFIVHKPGSTDAIVFDAGTEAAPILEFLQQNGLRMQALVLTHTHRDHVGGYEGLLAAWPDCQTFAPEAEPHGEASPVNHGDRLELCGLSLQARLTNGHSEGGMSYVIEGLGQPVAMVGDAIFAGSMGGAKQAYAVALRANREQILTLPEDTILCPGHGPMTTVGEELAHNPFFA